MLGLLDDGELHDLIGRGVGVHADDDPVAIQ